MFRLAKVLSWKERLEKEARVELAALEARQSRLEHDATQAAATRRSAPDAGEMSIDDLAAWAQYAESLRRRESQLREEAGRLTPEVEEKRQAHLVLRQEVEGLRKLQERYPGLEGPIRNEVAVAVDGVIYRDDWSQPLPEGAEVFLMRRLAGG